MILASLLRPVRLGKPYQEYKVPAGIARKVIEARKPPPPPPLGGDIRGRVGGEREKERERERERERDMTYKDEESKRRK